MLCIGNTKRGSLFNHCKNFVKHKHFHLKPKRIVRLGFCLKNPVALICFDMHRLYAAQNEKL